MYMGVDHARYYHCVVIPVDIFQIRIEGGDFHVISGGEYLVALYHHESVGIVGIAF